MRPLAAADLWRLHRVGPASPLPDGRSAVVTVTTWSTDEDDPRTRLFRVHADGADPVPLTEDVPGRAAQPAPSPDGSRVAYLWNVPGSRAQVHVMDAVSARETTRFPLGVRDVRWLPDGRRLLCVADLLAEAPDLEGTRARLAARPKRQTPRVTEDRVYRFWDRWLTGGEVPHLFVVDAVTGAARDLTPEGIGWLDLMEPTGQVDVAPDGSEIAFAANASEPPHERLRWAVYVVPTDGGEVRCLTPDHPSHARRPRYTPDGRFLVYGVQRRADFYADRVRVARFDRASGEETVLTEPWDRSASGWEAMPDGSLVLEAEDHGRKHLYRLAIDGDTPERVAAGGTCSAPRPGPDGSLWYLYADLRTPAELRFAPAAGEPGLRVTRFDDDLLREIDFGRVEERTVEGADGDPVQVFVVHPPGFDPSRTYPLVQLVHGGPHGLFGDDFHPRWNAQLFAAPGYVVAMVNFHGSSSFGTVFLESIHGRWGDQPARDVLSATDALLEDGFVDPERMAIAGGSYGGYLTAWLTSLTDRFACGICHAGVYDRDSMYASDVTSGMPTAAGALPWEDRETFERYNPADRAGRMRTPMLVIHGEKDYRVPYTQGLHLYGILKARGVPARLVCYGDENHWVLSIHNAMHWWGEVHGWLARWLGQSR